MADVRKLRGKTSYRGFHIGYPGSGKTGALAALANVGYKLRVLDFEGNYEPLIGFCNDNVDVDIVTLQDKIDEGEKYLNVVGIPQAFNKALKLMNHWKWKGDDGNEVDLGDPKDWGPDHIVVVDSLTSLKDAIKRRAIKMGNVSPQDMRSATWGHGVADLMNFIEKLKNAERRYHLVINCHKQIIGPKDFIEQEDIQMAKKGHDEILESKLDMIKTGMIEPRVYPVAMTKNNSQHVHGQLPFMLEFEKVEQAGRVRRIIKTESGAEIDVKAPSAKLKKSYGVETGMAEIFETLGYQAPGF